MATKTEYYSGSGRVYIFERDAQGNPTAGRGLADAGEFEVGLQVDTETVIEDQTGDRLTALRLQTAKNATVSIQLKSWDPKNLALVLYGKQSEQATTAVVGEVLPSALVAGNVVLLANQNVSNVVIKDSAASPATVSASKYAVNGVSGLVEFLDVAGYTQPFKADYSRAAASRVAMFGGDSKKEYWLRFDGTNTADGSGLIVDLYRVALDPASALQLITRQVATFPMQGSVLRDETKLESGELGQFGRVTRVYL